MRLFSIKTVRLIRPHTHTHAHIRTHTHTHAHTRLHGLSRRADFLCFPLVYWHRKLIVHITMWSGQVFVILVGVVVHFNVIKVVVNVVVRVVGTVMSCMFIYIELTNL